MDANTIIKFWFDELNDKDRFSGEVEIDNLIRSRFLDLHQKASQLELFSWRETALGRLAEIIILDQFSRNIFRDHPKAFACDSVALALSQEALRLGSDKSLSTPQKAFLYMPFMHSESVIIHQQAVKLFSQPGLENNLDYELKHKKIIDRFGHYPHRNKILGRDTTVEETEFLKDPNSKF